MDLAQATDNELRVLATVNQIEAWACQRLPNFGNNQVLIYNISITPKNLMTFKLYDLSDPEEEMEFVQAHQRFTFIIRLWARRTRNERTILLNAQIINPALWLKYTNSLAQL